MNMPNPMLDRTPTIPSDGELSVRILTSIPEIEGLRPAWEAMQWHPNADIDYYLLINRLHQQRPHVIVISRGGRVLTIGVGRVGVRRLKCAIGYKTVFAPQVKELAIISGGLMGAVDEVTLPLIIQSLSASLQGGAAEVVTLTEVKTDSPLWGLARHSPFLPCRDFAPKPQLHYGMALPKSVDGLFQNMKSKHRMNLKRLSKVLERDFPGEVRIRCFQTGGEVDQFCTEAERIAAKSYLRSLGVGFFDNAAARDQISLYTIRGAFRGYILYIKNQPCAFWYGNRYGAIFFVGMTAFDPQYSDYEIGTILLVKMFEDLVQNGAGLTHFDFGLGEAAYKSKFSTEIWEEATLHIFAPTMRSIGINLVRTPILMGRNLAQSALKRLQWEGRIKRFLRGRRAASATKVNQ